MRWRISFALIWLTSASLADPLTFLRSIPLKGLSGLSAIEVEHGGAAAFVLSDRGIGYRFTIIRNGNTGQLMNIQTVKLPYPERDTEGLAKSQNGTFFSYEGPGRISRDNGTAISSHPDFIRYKKNKSLEALAAARDGTLYTLPEKPARRGAPFPIYRYKNKTWDIAALLPKRGLFQPTGTDIGPKGWLYILERAFTPLGFSSRIRRFDPNSPKPHAETLITTKFGKHDNLEGISVWESNSGATCLTLVSDDNFRISQTSELVEYALTESLAGEAACD